MIINYLKIAWRHLQKNKTYSFIKIGGLGSSLAFCFLVIMFIRHEFSFNNFHEDKENIYRVEATIDIPKAEANGTMVKWFVGTGEVNKTAQLGGAVGQSLVDDIPEIYDFTRIVDGDVVIKKGTDILSEDIFYVDYNFFDFFSFPFMYVKPTNSFPNKNSVILTKPYAEKYFGNKNPVGNTLEIKIEGESKIFTVSGVLEDIPNNSSIELSVVIPIDNYPAFNQLNQVFESLNTSTFVKLNSQPGILPINQKLKLYSRSKFAGLFGNGTFEESADPAKLAFELRLTKLEDAYLIPDIVSVQKKSNPGSAYILGGIALLILFIGCTNYISLSLASSANRSLEVGIRKVLGAERKEVAKQFLGEAVIVSFISAALGLFLAEALTPVFNELTGSDIKLSLFTEPILLLFTFALIIIIGLIAGSYPALIISRFPSILAIAHRRSIKYRTVFTSILVGTQFALSSFLITSSVIMAKQMNFVSNKDVGYDSQNVIVIPTFHADAPGGRVFQRLKNSLTGNKNIIDATAASMSFGRGMWMTGLTINGKRTFTHYYTVEPNYSNLLGIKLKEGRNFNPEISTDKDRAIIVNETLARLYGGDVVGKQIQLGGENSIVTIIGVVKDYNFQSMLNEIQPMFLKLGTEESPYRYILFKTKSGTNEAALYEIKNAWSEAAPGAPFEYGFMEDHVNTQYEEVYHWQNVVNASTIFAVLIACLGLFGITGLQAINQTREIGIRKVLGAGIRDILYLVNKKILIISVIAFVISIPFSIEIITRWLEQFAFRIELSYDQFLIAGMMSLTIGVITVAFHSVRASLINPVETIKTE